MWKCVVLTIFITFLFSGVQSQDAAPNSTVSESTTTSASTTTPASTTTTPASTTTTPASTTTMPESTTTTLASTTTTEPPTTTSTEPPSNGTTTVAPEPIPKTEKGSWNVTEGNATCIRAEMAALFTIPVNDQIKYIALSPEASDAKSDCEASNVTQTLVLEHLNYMFSLEFEKDDKQIYVKNITFSYNIGGIQGNVYTNSSKYFSVKNGNSYLCNAKKSISIENVTLTLSEFHIQAFGAKDNTGFTDAEECDADEIVSNIVPIAVGCALAALVIVVLIAYLVGRRRSRQKGYQSV